MVLRKGDIVAVQRPDGSLARYFEVFGPSEHGPSFIQLVQPGTTSGIDIHRRMVRRPKVLTVSDHESG